MIGLTMKHLRYFDALARTGHFGRAAEDCAISQPALSIQIRELEQIVGALLVERGGRQIRLTSLGEQFAERVHAILLSVDELRDLARGAQEPFAGRFRLGIITTVAPYLLPQIIRALTRRHPKLDLRPREAVTQKLTDDLTEGRLDAAIVALPIAQTSFEKVLLFSEEFVLVRSRQDAHEPIPDPRRLHEMRLLLLGEGHCFRDQALSYCSITGALPQDLMEGSSLSTLVQMVGAGIGVTLIPQMAIEMETRSASVSVCRLPEPRPFRSIGLIWRKSNPISGQMAYLAEIVREVGVAAVQDSRPVSSTLTDLAV